MSGLDETRVADPTLRSLDWEVAVDLDSGSRLSPYVAHRPHAPCGPQGLGAADLPPSAAAWFCIPCRDCFPMAPEPGYIRCWDDCDCDTDPVPGLQWQVR